MANRVFLVEDDQAISAVIATNLQYTGYEYVGLANGLDAREYLAQDHAFDIAVLDIMLPGMDGFALLPELQRYNIPVLYLTAKADTVSKIKGLRDGAEDYMVKPFDVLELLVRIEKILDRYGKLNRVLHFQGIVIDLENRVVTANGKAVSLKPLEFDLLRMFVKYKNRTLPRERLLNEIWGVDFLGESRTVDVHVSQLRMKLHLHDALKKVPKIGYRLEDT